METLEILEDDRDRSKAVEARGLLLQIKQFSFVLSLVVFDKVLLCTTGLSDTLQCTNINLAKAADLATATIQILEGYRTTEYWAKVYSYATMVSNHHKIILESGKRSKRQSQLPSRFDTAMVLTSVGHREVRNISISEHFKVTLFYPVLDTFVSEFKKNNDFLWECTSDARHSSMQP